MLGKILKLFVGDKSKKDLKLINPIIEKIHSFEQEMNGLSNGELRGQTIIFKKDIQNDYRNWAKTRSWNFRSY